MRPTPFLREFRGDLVRPGDAEYERARRIHNGMIDRRPALIARCSGADDVIACVRYARENGAPVSVRGGGHGVAGFAVIDGGLMIDLSPMREISVDPVRRTARVGGGCTWGDVDRDTQAFGLATTGGLARPTGVAGLTLGGGHGFLMRRYGLACDNLISAEVVTAGGNLLKASEDENPELFWALRGGGGNFGIATSLEFRLHPVAQVLGGLLIYPLERAREVFREYRSLTAAAPDDLGSLAVIGRLPDGTAVTVVMVCYCGDVALGERLLAGLRSCAPLIVDQVAPMSYAALQSIVENFNPPGLRNYWKSSYLGGIPEAAVETIVDRFALAPSPFTHVVIEHLGGAVSRVGQGATAVAYRENAYDLLIVGIWEHAADDERGIRWVRELWNAMQPVASSGVYVNYLGDEGAARVRAAYTPEIEVRLREAKRRFDPENVFRLNQNIDPATAGHA